MKSSPSRGKLHSHSHAHRLSEESWGRDTRLWKLTKQILLFSLSFAVALHLYVKQSTLGGAPRPNGRSLREAEGARSLDTALLGDGGESGWASLGGGFVTPQRSRKSNSGAAPSPSNFRLRSRITMMFKAQLAWICRLPIQPTSHVCTCLACTFRCSGGDA